MSTITDIPIKLITKDTDISSLKMSSFGWDVVVNGTPYQVVRIDGYVHTLGGVRGVNDLWMYPRFEEPTYDNLVEFSCKGSGVCWGIKYEPHNYIRSKWDEPECFTSGSISITRNGEVFYDDCHSIDHARHLIDFEIPDHPVNFNLYGFEENLVGRKVWWRSEPGIVTRYIKGQACIIIEPDGIDNFTTPAEFYEEEGDNYYYDGDVKINVFSDHIWWFRD